jgi:hypothetical protein
MSRKQKRMFYPGVAVIVLTITAIVFTSARHDNAAVLTESPAQQHAAPEFKQHLRVFVHKDDIRPAVLRAWPGKAVVSVENESQADVSLQIERVLPSGNQSVSGVSLPAQAKRLPQEVTLGVGEYVFYETSRPTIRGRLIVAPRQ